jgi:predicted HicB family RNase H-like nuclease
LRVAAIQADTPRMTIRLSGEISAQITFEARKNAVSIETLVNRSRV